MGPVYRFAAALAVLALVACDDAPTTPTTGGRATVRLVYRGSTTRRADLPPSAQACASGVGATHTHPSWRAFDAIPLRPVPPDRYEITFDDVPVNTSVSLRVNDVNWCDVNPTGAVLRDVFANDVALVQNATTPGSGPEPGFAFSVTADGRVTQ